MDKQELNKVVTKFYKDASDLMIASLKVAINNFNQELTLLANKLGQEVLALADKQLEAQAQGSQIDPV